VTTPSAAGAIYTDKSTGNIWVAETTSNTSWVQSAVAAGSLIFAAQNF
jgi:hypothetical protein